jgi:hypothetical protein
VTRAVTKTWYRIALARMTGEPALVAAQGEHLGAAIAAAEAHVSGSHAFAVEVANGDVPLGESVGKHHIVELGTSSDTPSLHWPTGILPAIGHTAALASARRGWVEHVDPKLFIVEAQTDADHIVDLFLGMIEKLPAADNLEVRLQDHFEDAGSTEVWLTSRVNAKKILGFLDDFDDDLIHNGHVELSIYVREHKATLRLTEHKTVVWIAEDRGLATEIASWLRGLEVPKAEAITRVVSVPHFHLRPAKSRDRKALAKELFRQRLRRVDTVRPAATGRREAD